MQGGMERERASPFGEGLIHRPGGLPRGRGGMSGKDIGPS